MKFSKTATKECDREISFVSFIKTFREYKEKVEYMHNTKS